MPSDYTPRAPLALYAVARTLEIERARRVDEAPDAFTWWVAPGLRQRVQVEDDAPGRTPWLRIETPVWRGADPQAIALLIDALGQHARGAAVRHAPDSGDVSLVSRFPLPSDRVMPRAASLAGVGAIQAFLAAWAWGEANSRFDDRASRWRDALPHPELGMDVAPDRVLGYRERVLRPQAKAREGALTAALLAATTDAIERNGIGMMPQRRADGRSVAFAVDVGPTLGVLEVGEIRGPVDGHSLGVAISVHGHLAEDRAHACCFELLGRQLAPGTDAWTLGSWMPIPRRDGRPGFGLTHGLFLPLALAEPGMGPEVADAIGRTVELVRTWFEDGAPAPVHLEIAEPGAPGRLVA